MEYFESFGLSYEELAFEEQELNERRKLDTHVELVKVPDPVDYHIAEGFSIDCENIIVQWLKLQRKSFGNFKTLWKKMGFLKLYMHCSSTEEKMELCEELVFIAKYYMLYPAENIEESIAGLFIVYLLLGLQPKHNKVKITAAVRITPPDKPQILRLEKYAREKKRNDLLYILFHVLIKGPVHYVAADKEYGVDRVFSQYHSGVIKNAVPFMAPNSRAVTAQVIEEKMAEYKKTLNEYIEVKSKLPCFQTEESKASDERKLRLLEDVHRHLLKLQKIEKDKEVERKMEAKCKAQAQALALAQAKALALAQAKTQSEALSETQSEARSETQSPSTTQAQSEPLSLSIKTYAMKNKVSELKFLRTIQAVQAAQDKSNINNLPVQPGPEHPQLVEFQDFQDSLAAPDKKKRKGKSSALPSGKEKTKPPSSAGSEPETPPVDTETKKTQTDTGLPSPILEGGTSNTKATQTDEAGDEPSPVPGPTTSFAGTKAAPLAAGKQKRKCSTSSNDSNSSGPDNDSRMVEVEIEPLNQIDVASANGGVVKLEIKPEPADEETGWTKEMEKILQNVMHDRQANNTFCLPKNRMVKERLKRMGILEVCGYSENEFLTRNEKKKLKTQAEAVKILYEERKRVDANAGAKADANADDNPDANADANADAVADAQADLEASKAPAEPGSKNAKDAKNLPKLLKSKKRSTKGRKK